LIAAKARGRSLGGCAVRVAKADSRAIDLTPTIRQLQSDGARSLRAIAAGLNAQGIVAARGGFWSAAQVRSIITRIGSREVGKDTHTHLS